MRDDSELDGVIPLSLSDGWVAYSQINVCVDYYRIDEWLGVYFDWYINGQLIETRLESGPGDTLICADYSMADLIVPLCTTQLKLPSWGNKLNLKFEARGQISYSVQNC